MKKRFRSSLVFLCVLLISITFFSSVCFSAYIYQNRAKRVIATQKSGELQFSSNVLLDYDSSSSAIGSYSYSFTSDENGEIRYQQVNITVCNYPQSATNLVNDFDIEYDFIIDIYDKDGNEVKSGNYDMFKIKKNNGNFADFNSNHVSFEKNKLSQGTMTQDIYILSCPLNSVDFGNDYYILIRAVPCSGSENATSGKMLGRRITFSKSAPPSSNWSGTFEEIPDNIDKRDVYGFNYIIKGSGKGKVTLKWDSGKIEIDPLFLPEEMSKKENEISFNVDETKINYYSVQFYRTSIPDENENEYPEITFEFNEVK